MDVYPPRTVKLVGQLPLHLGPDLLPIHMLGALERGRAHERAFEPPPLTGCVCLLVLAGAFCTSGADSWSGIS